MLHLMTRGQTELGRQENEQKGCQLFGVSGWWEPRARQRAQRDWGRVCAGEAGG